MSTEDLIGHLANASASSTSSGARTVRRGMSLWSLSPVHHPSGKWTELASAISPTLDEALLAVVEAIQA